MRREGSFMRAVGCLLLIGCLLLCGCPAPSDGGVTSTTTTTTGGGQNPDAPTPTLYGNGADLAGTGDRLASDAAVLTPPTYTTEGAIRATAAEIGALLAEGEGLAANAVYVTTDDAPVVLSGAYGKTVSGNGAVILSAGGFSVEDCAMVTLSRLTLVAPLTVKNCATLTLEDVKIVNTDGVALRINAATEKVMLRDCRLDGATAVENGANDLYLLDSYIGFTENGILDASAYNLYIRGCRFVGTAGSALKTASDYAEIRENTFVLPASSTAITVGEAENLLIAENVIKDAQRAVLMTGAYNSVILRNSLVSVTVRNTKHAYICDNAMGGKITVSDIDYILADGNTYPDDEYNHETDQIGITNANGDSLMDVDRRLSAGADESLLPHIDRDKYFEEERKTVVRDPNGDLPFGTYIMENAKAGDVVIVAPGAYKTWEVVTLNGKISANYNNTTIYAYGVFAERSMTAPAGHVGEYRKIHHHFDMDYVENITIKGGTYGYEYQGIAQGHVIEKIPGTAKVRVKASAGLLADIGQSNTDLFESSTYLFRSGKDYLYFDTDTVSGYMDEDGTVVLEFKTNVYQMIEVGDWLATELAAGECKEPVKTDYSKGVHIQDTFVFANLSACSYHGSMNEEGVSYLRIANVYQNGKKISKETYDEYKALEAAVQKKGSKSFTTGVWYDEVHDCYRGPSFLFAGDGVHEIRSGTGNRIVSSLFERMTDDLSNQYAHCVRLSAIRDNGDGTADVIYKGNMSRYHYDNGSPARRRTALLGADEHVKVGEKVVVYTADGALVLDAVAISDSTVAHKLKNDPDLVADGGSEYLETRHVKVRYTECHTDALEKYLPYLDEYTDDKSAILDSCYNRWEFEYKVYFIFAEKMSEGTYFDNIKMSGGRAHGTMVRTNNVTIKNCTFENIAEAAIAVVFLPYWGCEATLVQNMVIENNLFSNIGFAEPDSKDHAAISIDAPGDLDITKTPLFRNITIRGNVIKNRANNWGIFVEGIDGVVIENNDLGRIADMEGTGGKKIGLRIENCLNVKIEKNKYPNPTTPIKMAIEISNVKGLTGKDVDDGDMFPDCK